MLGRIPGTRRFSDSVRHEDNEPVPGVLIVRPESGLVYFNIDHVRDRITAAAEATKPRLVLLDLSAAPRVDLQAAATLGAMHSELTSNGIRLQIVEAHASVRDKLRQEGLEEKTGSISRHTSVADAVDAFLTEEPQPA